MPLRSGGSGRVHERAGVTWCPVWFCACCRGVGRTAFFRANPPWLFVPSELLYICWQSHFLLARGTDSGFLSGSAEMHTTFEASEKEKHSDIWHHNVCGFRAEEATCWKCFPASSFGLLMSAVQLAATAQSPGARLSKKIIFVLCFLSLNWLNSCQLCVSLQKENLFNLLNWPCWLQPGRTQRTDHPQVARQNSCFHHFYESWVTSCTNVGDCVGTVLKAELCVLLQMRRVAQVGADGVRRVDWHDYEAIRKDAARTGGSPKIILRKHVLSLTHTAASVLSLFFLFPSLPVDFAL